MTALASGWARLYRRVWLQRRIGLTGKLAFIVVVGLVALIALFGYMGTAALNDNIQRSLQERVVVAQATARHIDYVLSDIERVLTDAAQQEALLDPQRRLPTLQSVYTRVSFFGHEVWLLDRHGNVIAAYPEQIGDVSFADVESVQAVLRGQSFIISRQAHPLGSIGQSTLAVAAVRDAASEVAGALVLNIDLNGPHLSIFSNPVGLGGTGYMDLVDANGVILASTRAERDGQLADHNAALAQMIRSGQPVVARCHDCHAAAAGSAPPPPRPEILAFAPLRHAPWGVTVRQDEEEVLAAARDLQVRIFTVGAIALLGALALVYLTTRSVIQPVQELTAAAQRIADGDLETPVEARGHDEIARLARAFDTMRGKLNLSIEVIHRWNRELDARVQGRTAELTQRNRELSAVNAIARVVGQSLKLDECLQLALAEVRRITDIDVGSIFLLEGEEGALCLHACYGISPEGAEATKRFGLSDAGCGGVLEIREVVVENVANTTRGSHGVLQREALASLVHVPLLAKGVPLGTLCLGTHAPRTFTEEEISLLTAIGSQIAVAVENARLYEELSRKEQLRGELLRRVISAQEDERKRIARELHDETSQLLSALLFTLDTAADTCALPQTQVIMDKMRRVTVSALDGVHKLIFDLRPTMLDQLGLVAALRWYAESRLGENGTRVEFVEPGQPRRLPAAVETALFRTVQEAINNIARHSGARRVEIAIHFENQAVRVHVEDDGIGFEPSQVTAAQDPACGFGLLSMEERMSAVGGQFFLTSLPGQGTTIELRVPLQEGNHGANPNSGG
jgi:signal transduction histidine kinase/HAMP domain-containing protein